MLQLQVSSSCARRFQSMARPLGEAVQSSQASRFAGFLSCGFDQRLSTILPVFRGVQVLTLCLETDEAMEYGVTNQFFNSTAQKHAELNNVELLGRRTSLGFSKSFLSPCLM